MSGRRLHRDDRGARDDAGNWPRRPRPPGTTADSADGHDADSADGHDADSADGHDADSADGHDADSADGHDADSADGHDADSADGHDAPDPLGRRERALATVARPGPAGLLSCRPLLARLLVGFGRRWQQLSPLLMGQVAPDGVAAEVDQRVERQPDPCRPVLAGTGEAAGRQG